MISIITRIQIEGNDTVSFLNGTNYVQGMSQIMPQVPTYISYGYDSISITQDGSKPFQFSVYTVTDVGGNSFTALNFQDPSNVVQDKTIEIYRLLVTSIFKGCCECGNTEPECSIQYTAADAGAETPGVFVDGGSAVRFNYFTANNQDFTGFWPIVQDGSWVFVFSKTDPTVYAVYQLSNYTDGGGGTFAQFDATLLAGPGGFPAGTSLCVDVTSVGGSLVQDWQDTLIIGSTLTQDNTVDGGGFDFVFDNNNSFAINAGGGSVEVDAVGASLNGGTNQVLVTPSYIDIITPGIGGASTGWVLSLTTAGHVEYVEAGTGTISSIGLFMPPAFTVSTPNPLTSNGDFTVTGAGTDLQYINGLGELATFPVYTVENGLHTKESPADPFVFHLGGVLIEDTVITTTDGTAEHVLGVSGTADQNTRRPLSVTNLGNGGAAVFSDYGTGTRPNPTVEMITDNDLSQPILNLHMQGDLPDANNTMLRLRYSGRPDLATTTIDYQFRNNNAVAANSNFIGSRLSTEVVSFVDNNEETRFNLQLIEGGALANKLQVQGYGQLVLNEYGLNVFSNGVSNIDNDLEYVLAVDSSGNVYKKISEGGGTVTEIDATGLLTTSPDPITTTGTVTSEMNSGFLVGRYDDGLGVFQEITVGTGLTLSATGELSADGSVPVYTVDNGLSEDPTNNFQLGGPILGTGNLVRNTYITNDGWLLRIDQSTGIGLEIYSEDDYASKHSRSGTTVNNFESLGAIRIDRRTSGVPFSGIGASIDFWIQPRETIVNPPPTDPTVRLSGAWLDPGPTFLSRRSTFDIYGYYNGGPLMNSSLSGIGQWQWYQYGQTPANFPDASPVWALGVDANGNVVEFDPGGGSGTTYDGKEGIYKDTSLTPETFMLGAPSGSQSTIAFSIDRYIDTSTKFLSLSGTGSSVLKADTNAVLGTAVSGNADSGYGVRGSSNDANSFGVWGGSKNGIGVYGESTNDYALFASTTSPVNTLIRTTLDQTSLLDVVKIERIGSGPINVGGGSSIATTLGTVLGSRISTYVSNGATGEISLAFQTRKDTATTESTNMVLIGDGQLQLNKYGQTPANFPDASPVWALGVDSTGNVVEFTPSTGTTYTVDNGLSPQTLPTANPDNFQLGGPLVLDTTIDGVSTYNLSFTNIQSLTGTAEDVYLAGSDGVNAGSLGLNSIVAAMEFIDGMTGNTSVLELSNAYSRFKHIDATASKSSAIELTGAELRVQTPLYATKTAGDVLTLLDPVTGEAEWSTPTGGGGIPFGIATGTDTYAVSAGTASTYTDGDAYLVRFTNGNTGGSTLNVNGIGARDMYSNGDGLLIGGDIWAESQMLCVYDSSLPGFKCIGTSTNSLFAYVTNAEATTITKGTAVYAFSGTGDRLTVKKALATGDSTSAQTVGMVFADIAAGQKGIILIQGELVDLNLFPTSGGPENWSDGEPVYLSSTVAGGVTRVKQYAPNHLVYLGICVKASNGSAGRMYVRIQNGFELDELHNVQAQTPADKDTLWYDNSVTPKQWKTASIPTILGYTPSQRDTFTLRFGLGPVAPADNTTYYMGEGTLTLSTVATLWDNKIAFACKLVGAQIMANNNTATATGEASTLYVRVNNTTDVLLSNAVVFTGVPPTSTSYTVTGLNQTINANDEITVKWVTPTWATNPTGAQLVLSLYFERT